MRTAANDNWPAAATIRFPVEPRLVPAPKAARRLHLTLAEFEQKRSALVASGFPRPCSVTGNYDRKAIDLWLDHRAGIGDTPLPVASAAQLVSERLAAFG